jgi:metal-responsive CopG/Arc/MetJ family transcriptional regulator
VPRGDPKHAITLRLPVWLVEALDDEVERTGANRTEIIEDVLTHRFTEHGFDHRKQGEANGSP